MDSFATVGDVIRSHNLSGSVRREAGESRSKGETTLNPAEHVKDWLTLFLAGLGVTFAPHEWIGGVLLALAGAAFAMRADPEQDARELWLVLLGAFLAAHIAAMFSTRYFPDFPVQAVMAGTGFFSRRITRFGLRLAGMVESRGDVIAGRVVDKYLPDPKEGTGGPDK